MLGSSWDKGQSAAQSKYSVLYLERDSFSLLWPKKEYFKAKIYIFFSLLCLIADTFTTAGLAAKTAQIVKFRSTKILLKMQNWVFRLGQSFLPLQTQRNQLNSKLPAELIKIRAARTAGVFRLSTMGWIDRFCSKIMSPLFFFSELMWKFSSRCLHFRKFNHLLFRLIFWA